jgi:hypothetical protein
MAAERHIDVLSILQEYVLQAVQALMGFKSISASFGSGSEHFVMVVKTDSACM